MNVRGLALILGVAGLLPFVWGAATGLLPVGDHMAIIISRTALESRGKLRICGDQQAITSTCTPKPLQHLLN